MQHSQDLLARLLGSVQSDHGDFEVLHRSLQQLENDVTRALDIVKSTISMVLPHPPCISYS